MDTENCFVAPRLEIHIKQNKNKKYVLVLSGVGLIFFVVTGMSLCLGFVLKTMLIM